MFPKRWLMVLVVALVLGLASAAVAYQNQLSAGDPAWVMDNLSADKVDVSIRSLDGKYGRVSVCWKCTCETGDWQRTSPVNVFGPGIARMSLQKSGCKVDQISFTCEQGQVTIQATCSGRSY